MITQCRYAAAVTFVILSSLLAACGGTRVTKIMHDGGYKGSRYGNVLVVAAADDYDARAQYERMVVSGIRATGAEATAYYTVLGRNPPLTVSDISNAVRARGFDAVLFTRVKGSTQKLKVKDGPASAEAVAKGGSVFDLFRYDYEEHDAPDTVRVSSNVVLLTELYDAAARQKMWAVETSSFDRDSVEQIVDSAAQAVVKALRRDGLIGRK